MGRQLVQSLATTHANDYDLCDTCNDKSNRPDAGPNFMIISCPECTAKFLIEATALGATGRMVRCGKCAHTWAEAPPETTSETIENPDAQDAPPRLDAESGNEESGNEESGDRESGNDGEEDSDPPFDADSEPDIASETDPFKRAESRARIRAGVPALAQKPKNIVARLAWGLLILFVLGTAGGGVFFQNQVVEAWPAAKRLYALMGLTREPLGAGLDLVNVKFTQQGKKGGGLLVEGEVENISDRVLDVPGLRATLFGKNQEAVQRWPFKAPLPRLLPGETVKFKTIIADPAKGATRIEIDFHEGDRQ